MRAPVEGSAATRVLAGRPTRGRRCREPPFGQRDRRQRMTRLLVWIGGVLFVTALAVCLWWYLFEAGQPRPWLGWAPVAADAFLVTLFALHHSLFARERVKQMMLRVVPEALLRSVYVWIASLLLIAVCFAWRFVGGNLYDVSGAPGALFVVVQLAGIAVIAQSVRAIDPLELAGIKPSSRMPDGGGLQVTGVYGLVRHPLYLGWVLAVFGAAHMTGDRLTFAALTTLYLAVAVPWEERSLVRSFGDSYRHYQKLVRWRMIPFIY